MATDPTIIQTRTFLGSISYTGIEYINSYANGGGIDRSRSEGEGVNIFKNKLGQGLKGNLEIVRAEGKPTEIYLNAVGPITSAVFGQFAEYVAVPGAGYHLFPDSPGNLIASWANAGYYKKQTAANTLAQSDVTHAPSTSSTGIAVLGVKGGVLDAATLATDYATPSNLTLFIAVYTPSTLATGTVWTTTASGRAGSANPDVALYIDAATVPRFKVYSAGKGGSVTVQSASPDTLYIFCVERLASGALSVYRYGQVDSVATTTGAVPSGGRAGMAILDGYSTAGPSDATVAAVTLVSRAVTADERSAYLASIYNAVHVIA